MSGFTRANWVTNVISSLHDKPNVDDGLNASQLKAKFDKVGSDIKDYINNTLLSELEGTGGAGKIGITGITGLVASNVQEALAAIYAAFTSYTVPSNAIDTAQIKDGAVTTQKLAANAVTAQKLGENAVRYRFDGSGSGIEVATSAWAAGGSVTGYPYRAAVALTASESLASLRPEVIFSASDAASGNFAAVAESYASGVYIYAQSIPNAALTIPVIELWR